MEKYRLIEKSCWQYVIKIVGALLFVIHALKLNHLIPIIYAHNKGNKSYWNSAILTQIISMV